MVIGFPSFTAESTVAIVTIGFNIAFVQYAGEVGVASYAMVNSIHAMTLLLFFGVGAALQPIASFHYGANLSERLREGLKFAVKNCSCPRRHCDNCRIILREIYHWFI